MSISFSIPSSHPAPLLTVDRVRAVLNACDYRSAAVLVAGTHSLAPGCIVSLQFGDQIATGAGGAKCLTIRCSIQINGGATRVRGVTCWQIRGLFRPPVGSDGLCIAVEADLILGSCVGLTDVLAHGGEAYRYLRLLVADAHATLCDLRIDDEGGREADGPVVRIEAKFLDDLAVGRSGLASSTEPRIALHRVSTTMGHLRMLRAACDCLSDEVLPDLARAVRSVLLRASPPIQSLAVVSAVTE
jgi:hypothetical protein